MSSLFNPNNKSKLNLKKKETKEYGQNGGPHHLLIIILFRTIILFNAFLSLIRVEISKNETFHRNPKVVTFLCGG